MKYRVDVRNNYNIRTLIDSISTGQFTYDIPELNTPDFIIKSEQDLILESIFNMIPMPSFYVDATDINHVKALNNFKLIHTLKSFIIDESITCPDGKKWSEHSRGVQRFILNSPIVVNEIAVLDNLNEEVNSSIKLFLSVC